MKVLNLRCAHDHAFEGWFASEDDYQSQNDRGLIECPMCGEKAISKLPSAPRLNVSGAREPSVPAAADVSGETTQAMTLQSMWMKAVQHVMATTVDVGDKFAEEARRIHYGETEERAIRGKASAEDARALQEEGIEVMALPIPAAAKGKLQ
ncbi:DUF1178 family protein [Piscinibacter gummiphilus]|uniref:DUF1178 family protein n=1 Tax=Piscinibacter gummiphilus TaxID=946333 RepID=A0ABZ0CZN1_9BURK|nr:DUF1178 family protein [Piscinibacter gummiphilus]WOB10434.1 DUF1178 family protein [Piscinibacter gummiphilus]